jgi:hypothetical protein
MSFGKIKIVLLLTMVLGLALGVINTANAQGEAEVGFFEPFEFKPNTRVEVPVEVRNIADLYALDIEIQFDPAVLQVEDAAPNQDGVQVALGQFLDAGLILFNNVSNEDGVIRFAMTQVNPSEPKSGDGVVLVLYFSTLAEGTTDLDVSFAEASTRMGEAIALEGVDGELTVSGGAADPQNTTIPVQDIELVTVIPTTDATAIPTATPEPTPIAPTDSPTEVSEAGDAEEPTQVDAPDTVVEATVEVEDVQEEQGTQETMEEEPDRKTLLDYWWIVLIVVGVAVVLAGILLLGKGK